MINAAVKQAQAEVDAKWAKELGVSKLAEAKSALEAKRAEDESKLNEEQKRLKAVEEREAAAAARESAALARERAAAVSAALVAAGAPTANVGDLVALVSLPADAADIDAAAVEAVKSVKEKFPALFAVPGSAPSGVPGGQPGQPAVIDDLADARARGTQWRKEHSTTADPLAGFRRVGAPPGA